MVRPVARLLLSQLLLLAALASAAAQFDPARVPPQAPSVAALFPEPRVTYATPSFAPGRVDFTTHAELSAFLAATGEGVAHVALRTMGRSQQGRAIDAAIFAQGERDIATLRRNGRPTVLIVGQQHGNEPAGGEAALAIIERLARGDLVPLLAHINVVVVPRANPDGAEAFRRATANGIDLNRDHVLARTPEARVLIGLMRELDPALVLDAHEYSAIGNWLRNFGGLARPDVLVQAATQANLTPAIALLQDGTFLPALRNAFDAHGLVHDWYFTADRDPKVVNMGGIEPELARNAAGLRHAAGILIETRGIGIGRTNWKRRVFAQAIAMEAALKTAARNAIALNVARDESRRFDLVRDPLRMLVVRARPTPERRDMVFVDPASGAPRTVNVEWRSSLKLVPEVTRPRPWGYVLPPSALPAARRLVELGIAVDSLGAQARLTVERYRTLAVERGAGGRVLGRFELERDDETIPAGSFFVTLDQRLATLAALLLEPDSASGYVAHGLVALDAMDRVPILRVAHVPDAHVLALYPLQ
ncbi:MAG: M14 family metallocarboxypeptidase [Alphaproteobacteria bacterium]|nr:M14 family metallocarboxypeptidase [Alphaproteobacteria bacterium]MCW5741141.1 M14 family metallocarboxypeptidase [Alphaproteobacteria bacterium]